MNNFQQNLKRLSRSNPECCQGWNLEYLRLEFQQNLINSAPEYRCADDYSAVIFFIFWYFSPQDVWFFPQLCFQDFFIRNIFGKSNHTYYISISMEFDLGIKFSHLKLWRNWVSKILMLTRFMKNNDLSETNFG